MILQIKTEQELLTSLDALNKLVTALQVHNKALNKKLDAMQVKLDKKPNKVVTKTIVKEIEKPTIKEVKTIELDTSIAPIIKKLQCRLKALEDKAPTIDTSSKYELIDIKKSILEIKPVINNVTTGVTDKDVLSIIQKHVTINYVNKLYKKGK